MSATPLTTFAKGGSSGGHASSSSHSTSSSKPSSSGSSSSKSSSATSKPTTSSKPTNSTSKTTTAAKPSPAATKASGTSRAYSKSGYVVGDGYTPRFYGGYNAPAGSVVYYPQHSWTDWLPWVYLFSHDSPSYDNAIVVQPNGQQVAAEPEKGVDGMVILNWALLFLIGLALIAAIVWKINKSELKHIHAVEEGEPIPPSKVHVTMRRISWFFMQKWHDIVARLSKLVNKLRSKG
jgi:cobalamin biosynthesis Mg chelatase CobN